MDQITLSDGQQLKQGKFSYSHCFMVIEMAQHCHKNLFQIVFSDNSNTSSSASGHSYEKLEVFETSSLKSLGGRSATQSWGIM